MPTTAIQPRDVAVAPAPRAAAPHLPGSPLERSDEEWTVDLAGLDSFPASDPPSWWSGPPN